MEELGKYLAELRKKHHYKQIELAEKLRVSQQVISNVERGLTTPDIEFLRGTADIYNISLDRLVGREFSGDDTDDIERQIISYIKGMDAKERKLSLGLVSQVVQHRGSNDGTK